MFSKISFTGNKTSFTRRASGWARSNRNSECVAEALDKSNSGHFMPVIEGLPYGSSNT
jgi:hypothetical protein